MSTKDDTNSKCDKDETTNEYAQGNDSNILFHLMEMFGNVPKKILNKICVENNNDLYKSIEEVVKYIENNKWDQKTKYFNKNATKNNMTTHNSIITSKNLGAIPKRYGNNEKEEIRTPTKTNRGVCSKKDVPIELIENIINNIIKGYKVIIIMRGAPGCGKTFLAKDIINKTLKSCNYSEHIFSTDNYFYDLSGQYKYNANYLKEAHEYNQKQVFEKIFLGWSPIIVDNTNIKQWEMIPYARVAFKHGYLVYILQPQTPWAFSAKILAKKNVHNVPKENIERMLNNFESGNAAFLNRLKSEYRSVSFPQTREYPPLPHSEIFCDNEKPYLIEKSTPIHHEILSQENYFQNRRTITTHSINNSLENNSNVNNWHTKTIILKNNNFTKSDSNNEFETVHDFDKSTKFDIEKDSDFEFEKKIISREESDPFAPLPQRSKKIGNLVDLLRDSPTIKTETKEIELDFKSQPTKLEKHKVGCRNENQAFSIIRQIYPKKQLDSLWDLFEKCLGDAEWAMDILLKDVSSLDYDDNHNNYDKLTCACDAIAATKIPENTIISDNITVNEKSCNSKNNRKSFNSSYISDEEKLKAKREIENQFVIGENYYSDYLRKVRSFKKAKSIDSLTKKPEIDSENSNIETETISNNLTETDEIVSSVSDANELVEITLGADLVSQLDRIFGTEINDKPTNYLTKVFMPKSLAQQLYIIWLESYFNQKEEERRETVKADEEFARILNDPKHNNDESPNNFDEYLDMETAWNNYKSEHQTSCWKNLMPTDLASHLSRMKLYELFPDLEKETLLEIYATHNFDYFSTIDFLTKSIYFYEDQKFDDNKKLEKGNSDDKLGSDKQTQLTKFQIVEKKLSPAEGRRISLQEFEDNRNLAVHYNQLKSECYQKAKEAVQKDNGAVAVYYSEIAKLHRNKAEMCNNKAANSIMAVHDLSQTDPDFIDLHYLHVNEALECLDYFIDKHISKITNLHRSYKNIFIITGRGLHSSGGISAIKTRVKSRLKERFLTWSEVNPGLLKVKVFTTSIYSEAI